MDPVHRAYILKFKPALKKETNCNNDLLDAMISRKVFTEIDKDEIQSEKSHDDRKSLFYARVMMKGKDAYQHTIDALKECNQGAAAELLEAVFAPDTKNEIDFVDNMDPLDVKIVPSTYFMDRDPTKDYTMRSAPRGRALIISNTRFPDFEDYRHGGQEDHVLMLTLFQRLGYECDLKQNVEKAGLETVLTNFIDVTQRHFLNIDSLVVVVMSHGIRDCIQMSDGGMTHLWTDIVYKFKDVLPGKPKMFFVEACQEFKGALPLNSGPVQGPMPDTLICFATQPGTSAARDIYLGTWFINCLAKVFMENAHDTHLVDLLKLVQKTMYKDLKGEHNKNKQLCYWTEFQFKNVYFNPGLNRYVHN